MTTKEHKVRNPASKGLCKNPMDEEVSMTYRQIAEFRIQAGMEALDNAIDMIRTEKEDVAAGRSRPTDALTLLQQQRSAYEAHLTIERASTKANFLSSLD